MTLRFDFCIGNPPYQEETKSTSDSPIYHHFMDSAYQVADRVELITPARFLFSAGKTSKAWDSKMLNDSHLKVLKYCPVASDVFQKAGFKGGVVVTYRDANKNLGPIVHFIPNEMLRQIVEKVHNSQSFSSISNIVNPTEYFRISNKLYEDHPEFLTKKIVVKGKEVPLVSKGHENDLTSNILDKNGTLFFEDKPKDGCSYRRVFGRQAGKRVFRYIKSDYLEDCEGLKKYKVIVAESNNSGKFGEALVDPIVGDPDIATTQTFITIGFFDNKNEANALLRYISGKFARAMLGSLKITQHNKRDTWTNVPLQDFSSNSDIDWLQPVHNIDCQLYKKYDLTQEEIDFIESHVKEMS